MSDVVHLLDEYRADEESSKRCELKAELRAVKEDKKKTADHQVEVEDRAFEIAKKNSTYVRQVSELEIAN